MRTINIKNDEIKALLDEKSVIVKDGQNINVEIEKKAEPFVASYLLELGVTEDGDSTVAYGDGKQFYKNFKGTFNQLQNAFKDSSIMVLQNNIQTACEDDLNSLKAKENQVQDINEKVSSIIKDIIPTLGLEEFEELTTVDCQGDEIVLSIVDRVEDYKEALRNRK